MSPSGSIHNRNPIWLCASNSMLVSNVISFLFLVGADVHGLDVKLDATEWLLLFFFDQNLGAICDIRPPKIQPMVFCSSSFGVKSGIIRTTVVWFCRQSFVPTTRV